MLHAPSSETKTEATQSKSAPMSLPAREQHPPLAGWAEAHDGTSKSNKALLTSPDAHRRGRFTSLQQAHGNQAVIRLIHQTGHMGNQRPGASQPAALTAPPIVHEALRSSGQPLDPATRAFMEPRFGSDLSGVRVHTDEKAAQSARAVNALAYTVGNNIVFATGQYAPATDTGRQTLAHELAHTIQQGTAPASSQLRVTQPSDIVERSAEQAARRAMIGEAGVASRLAASPPQVMRQTAPPINLPLNASIRAQAMVFEADENWAPRSTTPTEAAEFRTTSLGGMGFIPPIQLHIDSGHRAIFEILISLNGQSVEAFFWRCDATNPPGTITRLEPMGAQASDFGGDPVLGPLQPFQSNTATTGTIQVTAQVGGSTTSTTRNPTQGQVGIGPSLQFPDQGGGSHGAGYVPGVSITGQITFPSTATQRNPPQLQYNVAFNADIILRNAPPAPQPVQTPTVPDQQYFVNFANDSATISSAEITNLLIWSNKMFSLYPHLRDAIRSGQVTVRLTGRASIRGNAQHNFTLSQRRVDTVRTALEGGTSATGGGRTQGGVFGSERVNIEGVANGDFHDPMPTNIDQDRVVEIFIDGAEATAALQRLANPPAPTGGH